MNLATQHAAPAPVVIDPPGEPAPPSTGLSGLGPIEISVTEAEILADLLYPAGGDS